MRSAKDVSQQCPFVAAINNAKTAWPELLAMGPGKTPAEAGV